MKLGKRWEILLYLNQDLAFGFWMMRTWYGFQVLWFKVILTRYYEPIEPIQWIPPQGISSIDGDLSVYYVELLAENAKLKAYVAELEPFERAIKSRHNGYDPIARELTSELTRPETPEQALDDLLEEAEELKPTATDLVNSIEQLRAGNKAAHDLLAAIANDIEHTQGYHFKAGDDRRSWCAKCRIQAYLIHRETDGNVFSD